MSVRGSQIVHSFGSASKLFLLLSLGFLLGIPLLSVAPTQAAAQETNRIWGQVETAAGRVYEGFIRWDRNEGSWVDLLNGDKEMLRENQEIWMELADQDRQRRDRTIEFLGISISWDDRDFPGTAESGIRFGHIERMIVLDDDAVELELKSGERIEFEGGSTDIGREIREILIDDPREGLIELDWRDLDQIRFSAAPATGRPEGLRLYGTVEDRWGGQYTGYVSWDLDEIFTSDILDGEEDGRDREIPFSRIAGIERDLGRSRVIFNDGEEMILSDSNDVDDGNRGIQISDPGLGMVEVEWDEFESIRFHDPAVEVGYEEFDGGHRLSGTVLTRDGEEYSGWIKWDADEEYSWEMLDGEDRNIVFDVEFGKIAAIERDSSRSALVTLTDGRVLEMEGSNDVNEDNKGILVQVDEDDRSRTGGWVLIDWRDFQEIRFHH